MDKPEFLMRKPISEWLSSQPPLSNDLGYTNDGVIFSGPCQSKRNKENKEGLYV